MVESIVQRVVVMDWYVKSAVPVTRIARRLRWLIRLEVVAILALTSVGCLESSVTRIEATAAIAALKKFDVGPAMPAFFRLALTTVAVKSLLPNFPHSPTVINFV